MAIVPDLMTYEEVAEYCGVSKSAVRKWAHSRQIPTISLGYKIKRISSEALNEFLKKRTKL